MDKSDKSQNGIVLLALALLCTCSAELLATDEDQPSVPDGISSSKQAQQNEVPANPDQRQLVQLVQWDADDVQNFSHQGVQGGFLEFADGTKVNVEKIASVLWDIQNDSSLNFSRIVQLCQVVTGRVDWNPGGKKLPDDIKKQPMKRMLKQVEDKILAKEEISEAEQEELYLLKLTEDLIPFVVAFRDDWQVVVNNNDRSALLNILEAKGDCVYQNLTKLHELPLPKAKDWMEDDDVCADNPDPNGVIHSQLVAVMWVMDRMVRERAKEQQTQITDTDRDRLVDALYASEEPAEQGKIFLEAIGRDQSDSEKNRVFMEFASTLAWVTGATGGDKQAALREFQRLGSNSLPSVLALQGPGYALAKAVYDKILEKLIDPRSSEPQLSELQPSETTKSSEAAMLASTSDTSSKTPEPSPKRKNPFGSPRKDSVESKPIEIRWPRIYLVKLME
ncbi:MAG: hypothetical protein LBR92_01320 [Puniceicoccales bacterium]|nr:hypothetical protein [Puniceicoccales bacterium]